MLVVSFGHNDANHNKAERYVSADAFGESLRPFWDTARSHGAACLFASPVAMREFDESGVCRPAFAAYREAMRAFAAEVGAPFIDLGAATAAMITKGNPLHIKYINQAIPGMLANVSPDGRVLNVSGGTAVMKDADGYRGISRDWIQGWGQGLALAFFAGVLNYDNVRSDGAL